MSDENGPANNNEQRAMHSCLEFQSGCESKYFSWQKRLTNSQQTAGKSKLGTI